MLDKRDARRSSKPLISLPHRTSEAAPAGTTCRPLSRAVPLVCFYTILPSLYAALHWTRYLGWRCSREPVMNIELNDGISRKPLPPCRSVEHPLRTPLLCLIAGPVASSSSSSTFADDSSTSTTSLFTVGSSIADTGTGYSLFRGPEHGSKDYWIECSCSNGASAVRSCPFLRYKCYCADKPSISCNQ